MAAPITLMLSAPNLAEREKDYLEDLAATLPGNARARVEAGRLGIEVHATSPGVEPDVNGVADRALRAIAGAHVAGFGPDVLTLDEISVLIGLPATSLAELQAEYSESFPSPVLRCAGHWHLAEVLCWVRAVGAIAIDDELLRVARLALSLNESVPARRLRSVA